MPQRGGISMRLIEKKFGVKNRKFTRLQMHKAVLFVLQNIFDTYTEKYTCSESQDGSIVFFCDRFCASISVWVSGLDILYIVQTKTAIGEKSVCELWFSEEHMVYQAESFLNRLLYDFSELVSEVSMLHYSCDSQNDTVPSGTYYPNGSWFCSKHEDTLLRPRHYYEGMIDYDAVSTDFSKDGFLPNDWDGWVKEIFDKIHGKR